MRSNWLVIIRSIPWALARTSVSRSLVSVLSIWLCSDCWLLVQVWAMKTTSWSTKARMARDSAVAESISTPRIAINSISAATALTATRLAAPATSGQLTRKVPDPAGPPKPSELSAAGVALTPSTLGSAPLSWPTPAAQTKTSRAAQVVSAPRAPRTARPLGGNFKIDSTGYALSAAADRRGRLPVFMLADLDRAGIAQELLRA